VSSSVVAQSDLIASKVLSQRVQGVIDLILKVRMIEGEEIVCVGIEVV